MPPNPVAMRAKARSVSALASHTGSSLSRRDATASLRSCSASCLCPSMTCTPPRRKTIRPRLRPDARPAADRSAVSPEVVRPAKTRVTPSVASTSVSRTTEQAFRARRRASRSSVSALSMLPNSRMTIAMAWWATEASNGEGRPASSRRALVTASFGRASASSSSAGDSSGTPLLEPVVHIAAACIRIVGDALL